MKLLEYEAKSLLSKAGVGIPSSSLISPGKPFNIELPVVLKSQVPTGARGKAGGIKIIEDEGKLQTTIDELFALNIKNFTPTVLLAEERLSIKNEYYLSLIIDRLAAEIRLVAHNEGGVEVEDNKQEGFLNIAITKSSVGTAGEQLAEYFELPGQSFALQDLVERLYDCFVSNDASLLEINPLVFTGDDLFIPGDCKMELDNNAHFRHPEWNFEEKIVDTNFVTLDPLGTVATIANGAGLAMATVDAVAARHLKPANFLDIGGGATAENILLAFRKIMEYKHVEAIIINVFAGITRCDEVARAIISAQEQLTSLPPLYIRLAGTNFEEAIELLAQKNIPTLGALDECLDALQKGATNA